MQGVGLILEEHREAIVESWRAAVQRLGPPALEFAVPIFLRELARALRHGLSPERAWERCAVLVRRSSPMQPSQVVRELALLRRAIWSVIRQHRRAVPPESKQLVDALLDETMAALLEALTGRRPGAASPEPEPTYS